MIWGSSAGAEIPHALVREASAEGRLGHASTASTRRWSACRSPGRSRADAAAEAGRRRRLDRRPSASWTSATMAVGGAPCMVNRVTYTGDLGYEIWMAPAYQRLRLQGDQGGRRGIRHRRFRHARAALDAAGEELPDLVPRAAADLRRRSKAAMDRFIKLEQERLHRPRGGRARSRPKARKLRRVSLHRRCGRRRRDGRRADLGQGLDRLRHGRKAAWLRRAALRRHRQGSARLDGGGRRFGRARHRRRRLARGRLGHVGRLCALCAEVDGAGLRAGRTGRGRKRRPVRDRDSRPPPPGPHQCRAAVRSSGEKMRG